MIELKVLSLAFWLAFVVSAAGAYPIYKALLALRSRQTVSQYAPEGHQKKQGTPTMGGLIVVLGGLVGIGWGAATQPTAQPLALGAFVLLALFALIGFVDDFVVPRMFPGKRGLGWKQKIAMQVVAAAVGAGIVYGWSFGAAGLACVFLVLFFSNAYNFSDGLDSLAGTLLLGLGGGLAFIGFLDGGLAVPLILLPLLAGVIPFLYLNAPPAKVFMGDVGSLGIGAVLGLAATALMAIPPLKDASAGDPNLHLSGMGMAAVVAIAGFMMVVELVPVPLQILSVKLRKKRLFPYTPIHHAFEKAGWPETRVVAAFALTQLLLSLLAVAVFVTLRAA